jgi:hypothetical protein
MLTIWYSTSEGEALCPRDNGGVMSKATKILGFTTVAALAVGFAAPAFAYEQIRPVNPSYETIRPVNPSYETIRPVNPGYETIRPVNPGYETIRPVKPA